LVQPKQGTRSAHLTSGDHASDIKLPVVDWKLTDETSMSRARPGVALLLDFAHAIRAFAAAVIYAALTHSHATPGCLIPTK
jgi:hypothetical protein